MNNLVSTAVAITVIFENVAVVVPVLLLEFFLLSILLFGRGYEVCCGTRSE